MEFTNIHFADGGEDHPSHVVAKPESVRLKLRKRTVSPHEEYQLRAGTVAPISDSLAALILSRKGRVEVTLKGVKIDRVDCGGVRWYFHEDSITINDLSQRSQKMFYVVNPLKPDILHILDHAGRYVESLPEKSTPGVLNIEEQEREAARNARVIGRVAKHLQRLHAKDTEQALEDLRHNSAEMLRVTQVLPAPQSPRTAPAPSPLGDRIAAGTNRIETDRARVSSALSFGRAATKERSGAESEGRYIPSAEDWSDRSRSCSSYAVHSSRSEETWETTLTPIPTTPTEIEPW